MALLVVNAGSSSLKAQLYSLDGGVIAGFSDTNIRAERGYGEALKSILYKIEAEHDTKMTALAHRVVHGGSALTESCRITKEVRNLIEDCIPLAPLHNPASLSAIDYFAKHTDLPQYASFDTGFHATIPDVARDYPVQDLRERGIRRYGFHGLSYAGMVRFWDGQLPKRLLACHLGNGASLCAIKNGQSVATTMGYSPLGGLMMGTRSGDIDPGAVLEMVRQFGLTETEEMLNRHSGLTALTGTHDMAEILGKPELNHGAESFAYWAARHAGSMIAAMGGIDAIAFTGGIGENAVEIRSKILSHLNYFGGISSHVISAKEEDVIAQDALNLMQTE